MKQRNQLSTMKYIAIAATVIFWATNATSGVEECDYVNKDRFPTEHKACIEGLISAPESVPISKITADESVAIGGSCYVSDVEVTEITWDKNCGGDSLFIKTKNASYSDSRVKICIEQETGKWDCGSEGPLKSGDTHHYWACKPTGKYIVQSYEYNDDIYSCFPKNKETNKPLVHDYAITHTSR